MRIILVEGACVRWSFAQECPGSRAAFTRVALQPVSLTDSLTFSLVSVEVSYKYVVNCPTNNILREILVSTILSVKNDRCLMATRPLCEACYVFQRQLSSSGSKSALSR